MRWLTLLLVVEAVALGGEYQGSSSTFTQAVQDGTGIVWCKTDRIDNEQSTGAGNKLYATDGKSWRVVACPAEAPRDGGYFYPASLAGRRDGSVLCLWHVSKTACLISSHRGDESALFARLEAPMRTGSEFFEDSHGDIWLTGTGPRICRIHPDGTAEVGFEIKDAYRRAVDKENRYDEPPVQVLEDDRHRIWFWSSRQEEVPGLLGVLIFDGKKFTHHPSFEGMPAKPIVQLAHKDAGHLWLHVAAEGLYELDIGSLKARRIEDPEPGAFKHIRKIFQADGADWLVADPEADDWQSDKASAIHWTQRRGILWRWDGAGWKRAITGLDDDFGMWADRPWLVTEQGLWIGCEGSGPHLLPRDGGKRIPLDVGCDSIRLDWRFGIDIPKSSWLFKMDDGRMMIVGKNAGVQFAPLPLTENREPDKVRIEHFRVPILRDAHGVLWGLPTSHDAGLRSKDSGPWRDHSLPRGVAPQRVGALGLDDAQRVWLLPDDRDAETAIFDPALEKWEAFASYEAALQAQLPRRPRFSLAAGRLTPAFSKDGRIAFSNPSDKVHYFDGKEWSRADGIVEIRGGIRATFIPFFNAAGRLAFNYWALGGDTTLEFEEGKGWRNATHEPNPVEEAINNEPEEVPPPGCITSKPRHIVKDNLGTFWLTWRQMLYRAVPGACVPIFDEGQPSPFLMPCWLREAFVANDGEIYLHTWRPEQYCIPILPKPLPETELAASKPSASTVHLEFHTSTGEPHWFRWRRGDQPWSEPARTATAEVRDLAAGTHRFEVVALDRWLRADPTPAVCTVEIAADAARTLTELIAALGAADFSLREQAVQSLKQRGPAVIPELKKALDGAPDDVRWWIEAAIQGLSGR